MKDSTWLVPLSLLALAFPLAARSGEDLGAIYSGDLDYREEVIGRSWRALGGDVWELDSFSFALKDKLEIKIGPAVVVFGQHTDGGGHRSALWATVFPRSGSAEEGLVSSEPGHGDHVTSLFLRFHPSLVGELFPERTVTGQGDPLWLVRAIRVSGAKIGGSWQAGGLPVVPPKWSLVVDAETVEGKRRCYVVDSDQEKVDYVAAFAERALPEPPSENIAPKEALELFDEVWGAFDREYAMFALRPEVDWDALRELYRPLAARVTTNYELGCVLGLLLAHLEDLHVFVKVEGIWIPGYNRWRPQNANWRAVKQQLSELVETEQGIAWGRAGEGIGTIVVWNLTSPGLSDAFDEALAELKDSPGLILDLRYNGGGDENIGRRIAGRFATEETTYSFSRIRNGQEHRDLGPKRPRSFEPRGPWRYSAPVAVLIGRKTFSSAESLALMLAGCPGVTTIGDHTAGSSGNPRLLDLGHGIVVNLPRWIDYDPEGQPIDGVGVAPMLPVEWQNMPGSDPVFEAALGVLDLK